MIQSLNLANPQSQFRVEFSLALKYHHGRFEKNEVCLANLRPSTKAVAVMVPVAGLLWWYKMKKDEERDKNRSGLAPSLNERPK